MTMILGIDYGLSNIGLAVSEGELAEPYGTIGSSDQVLVTRRVKDICEKLNVTKIVVGISEGKSRELAIEFGKRLSEMVRLPVEFADETLTSLEADSGRQKDKDKIHERAAAVILQRYLDEKR